MGSLRMLSCLIHNSYLMNESGPSSSRGHRYPHLSDKPSSYVEPAMRVIQRFLPLSGGHVMHVEEHGDAAGIPAIVLHGGPGSGTSPLQRSFFDPARYRIVCPDQRGAGRSTPRGAIEHNNLTDLLADLRLL